MEAVRTYKYKSHKIEIFQDINPADPREWDNLGHIWCWHRRYLLGDSDAPDCSEVFWDDEERYIETVPLYLLDHSGLALRTMPFSCLWDSGQVGLAFVTREDVLREYDDLSEESIERAKRVLAAEIKTYCDYISGNVYGYSITDPYGEELDSCWGYYGDVWEEDSSLLEEIRASIDTAEVERVEYIERLRKIASSY